MANDNHIYKNNIKRLGIHNLFEEQVRQIPDSIAVIANEKSLSYKELNEKANYLGNHLTEIGIGPDKNVAICMSRSVNLIVAILGILKSGGAYIPLDPDTPNKRIENILELSQTSVLITDSSISYKPAQSFLTHINLDQNFFQIQKTENLSNAPTFTSHNLAYVIFTSGSTGQPKGVMIEHQQLLNYLEGIKKQIGQCHNKTFATVSTAAADLGNTMIFASLCYGGTLHILSKDTATSAERFAKYMQEHSIDIIKIVPTHFSALFNNSKTSLPNQLLILGGELLSWKLVKGIREVAPNLEIINHYGPTETTIGITTYKIPLEIDENISKSVPIGKPLDNNSIYILDDTLAPVPKGNKGTLYISGLNLSRGYFNKPELTKERFITNPFIEVPSLMYNTGDVVYSLLDGNIVFIKRLDKQVKIGGQRIELGEIETALCSLKQIDSSVIRIIENNNSKQIVAFYVSQSTLSSLNLRRQLRQILPDYMIPSQFIKCDSIPFTDNGKINYHLLDQKLLLKSSTNTMFLSINEKLIANIWKKYLNVKNIKSSDNFFDLGGSSLLGIQMLTEINKTLYKDLTLRDLMTQTLGQLAILNYQTIS